ncbi:MAG: hypothetical protein ACP5KD_01415 [Fervidobacterium sp.]|jgi:hypothetical protein
MPPTEQGQKYDTIKIAVCQVTIVLTTFDFFGEDWKILGVLKQVQFSFAEFVKFELVM